MQEFEKDWLFSWRSVVEVFSYVIYVTFDLMGIPSAYTSMLNNATSFPWLSSATLFCSQPSVMQNTVWLSALCDTPDLICQNEANLGIFGEGNLEDWSKSYSNHSSSFFFSSFFSVWLVIRYRQRLFILNTRLDLDLYNNWQTLLDNWAKETGRQMQRSGIMQI